MSVSVNETEAKYEAAPDLRLPTLDELPQVTTAVSVPEQLLVAVYYDTPDLRLLRAKITLRRRTGGSDAGWHLKLRWLPEPRGNSGRCTTYSSPTRNDCRLTTCSDTPPSSILTW